MGFLCHDMVMSYFHRSPRTAIPWEQVPQAAELRNGNQHPHALPVYPLPLGASLMRQECRCVWGGVGGCFSRNYPSDHLFLETRFPGFLDADHNDTSRLSSPLCDCSEAFVVVVVVAAAIAVHQSLLSRFNVQFLAKSEQNKTNKRTQNRGHNFQDTFD